MSTPDSHLTTTFLLAGLRQLTSGTLTLLGKYGPPAFDTSHQLLTGNSSSSTAGIRWDAIHYLSVAKDGYEYEQQLAFMPFWPGVIWVMGYCLASIRGVVESVFGVQSPDEVGYTDLALGAGLFNLFASAMAIAALYKLTRTLTGSHRFAQLSCIFYALPPHPAAALSPYTEPLYAFLTFTGFLLAVKRRWVVSAVLLALATGVRATGIFNVAVLGWQILFGTALPNASHFRSKRLLARSLLAVPLCLMVIGPFFAFQYYAYRSFCLDQAAHRPWCDATLPIAYNFVQAEYWNNGLLNYWTLDQLPNFLLASPVLAISILPSVSYLRHILTGTPSAIPHQHPALLPFHLLHLFHTALLVFGSHVQIALRTAITDPVVWWNVAAVAFRWQGMYAKSGKAIGVAGPGEKDGGRTTMKERLDAGKRMTTVGRVWVSWAVVWGAISLVLWSAHLPPA